MESLEGKGMFKKMKKNIVLALTEAQLILLKNSEEAKDVLVYGNLYATVFKYEKLTKENLDSDPDFDKKSRLALTLNKNEMLERMMLEWKVCNHADLTDENQMNCQLCHAPTSFIYTIRNKKNNLDLQIGLRCITKFPELEGYTAIRALQRKSDQAKIEKRRAIAINENIPGIKESLNNYRTAYDEFSVLLPWGIYKGLDKQLLHLQKIYDSFVKSGNLKNMIAFKIEYDAGLVVLEEMFSKADEVKKSNLSLMAACKRDEYMWLKEGGNTDVLDSISKNNGLYSIETVKHMISHKFMDDMKTAIEKSCVGTELKLKAINYEEKRVSFDVDYLGNEGLTEVYVTYSDFMKNIGCYIFFDDSYRMKMNINIFKITNYPKNLKVIMTRVNKALADLSDEIQYSYDNTLHELYFDRKADSTYKKIGVQLFLDNYMPRIKMNEELLKKEYLNEYRHLCRSENWKKIDDRGECTKPSLSH